MSKLRPSPVLDAFAERLSVHGNIALAASEIGRNKMNGQRLFQALRDRLGREQTR